MSDDEVKRAVVLLRSGEPDVTDRRAMDEWYTAQNVVAVHVAAGGGIPAKPSDD